MNAEQFTYWLNGFLETANPKEINEQQTQIIKDHLALVFTKTTPSYKNGYIDGIPSLYTITPPAQSICGTTPVLKNGNTGPIC